MKDETRKITYTNGEQTGPYAYYKEGELRLKGSLKDGLKHGAIIFYYNGEIYHCDYEKGSPVNGTSVVDSWGEFSITEYKNKKRHGKRIFKDNDYTRITHYVEGAQAGEIFWELENGDKFVGVIKDRKPYNGDFYDPEFYIAETYINGQKQGLHKSNFGAMAILLENCNQGIKGWE